jgi:Uncharacterized conserved protein
METYTSVKPLVFNPGYSTGRQNALDQLKVEIRAGRIDPPLIDILTMISGLPCCYTLQSCFGHFVHEKQRNEQNFEPLARYEGTVAEVTWRIAYMAFCIEDSPDGRALCSALQDLTTIDPNNVQFGCADWFLEQCVNSYVFQVSPERFRYQDTMILSMQEALQVEHVRDLLFQRLCRIISAHPTRDGFTQ